MNEFLKVSCVVVLLIGLPAAAIAWFNDRPDETTWLLRWIGSGASLVAFLLFLKLHFRSDRAPDFLRQQLGEYFNRGGFCFAIDVRVDDEAFFIDAWFQNQFERPCRGRIALRPSRGFLLDRPDLAITLDVECGPGAFGVASVPVPVPRDLHGKRQKFEIGASVEYPSGKGRRLRFHEGMVLRTNASFGNPFGAALTTAGAMTGSIIISKPASIKLELPIGVSEAAPENWAPATRTLWELGGTELEALDLGQQTSPTI